MMDNEYGLEQSSKRNNSVWLGVCALGIVPVMIILTLLFLPKSYGEILSCQESYPSNGPFTFIIEVGEDEYWHVKSWTETPQTNYNVTLTGQAIEDGTETGDSRNSSFACKWSLSLNSSGRYNSYEFDTRVPSSSNGKWSFNLLLEGHGSIHIVITKFDRLSFYKFFIPDLVCGFVLFTFAVFIIGENEFPEDLDTGPSRLV